MREGEEKEWEEKQSVEGGLTNLRRVEEEKEWRKEQEIKKYEGVGKR